MATLNIYAQKYFDMGIYTFSFEGITTYLNAKGEIKKKCLGMPLWKEITQANFTEYIYEHHRGLAVLTGKISNITCIDFDQVEAYERMAEKHPELKEFYTVKTNKGFHVYCRYNEIVKTTTNAMISYEGVDIRNDDAILYAPPTKYKIKDTGTVVEYKYLGGEILELPSFILDDLKQNNREEPKTQKKIKLVVRDSLADNVSAITTTTAQPQATDDIETQLVDIATNTLLNEKKTDLTKLISCLSAERATNYNKWVQVMFMFVNELGQDGEDLFLEFSKKSATYDKKNCIDFYRKNLYSDKKKTKKEKLINIASGHFWAKEDNEAEYLSLFPKYEDKKEDHKDNWKTIFKKIVVDFEKTHCKILNNSLYIKTVPDKFIFMSKPQLIQTYEHIECGFKEGAPVGFISRWVSYNDKINKKDGMDFFPPPLICPDNMFNLWRPFDMELLTTPYDKQQEGLDFILNHIKILCNHNVEVYDYMIKWIAQMIQYPAIKSIVPVLISNEGAGKGTLLKLMTLMFGREKVMESSNPSRDVWGDFNGAMASSFLVNLNELGKKDIGENCGKLKALITDTSIVINNKGVNQFQANSYHRFIITTNKEDPIQTSNDDRRNLIIRSSDEKCKNYKYFDKINEYLDDINVIRTCFDYFKKEIKVGHHLGPIPQTEYQQNLKEGNRTAVDLWLEDFTRENIELNVIEKLGKETIADFECWRATNNIKYETNATKLGIMLLNMKLPKGCIEKGRHTRSGDTKYFNIQNLKKHYNLGCLVDINDG